MAIGTITMILANVGLSIFNNWAGSRQNKQIAEKREEFERAVREGQRERMLQLMREGQQLTLELEEQKHKERLSELNDQFDNLIKELAYSAAIEHWPLKTLPIVMKNQALGNLLANQEEKVALHCILTSSNCREFNDYVLPKVESTLEAYCNVHWSTLTGSPVLFYSGAWKSNDVPTGTQVDSMRAALSNLPTLLITPFFRPHDHKLVFQVHVWGVGYNNSDQFTIPVIEPTEFQRNYTDELKWLAEDGLIEEAVEDLVPYLQCLIGYMADTYFWSAFGSVPQLPRMLTDGSINTDGMKYLVDDTCNYYSNLLTISEKKSHELPFAEDNLLNLFEGSSALWDEKTQKEILKEIFAIYVSKFSHKKLDFESAVSFVNKDMNIRENPYVIKILSMLGIIISNEEYKREDMISYDDSSLDLLKSKDLKILKDLSNDGNVFASYRLAEMYEYSILPINSYNKKEAQSYYNKSLEKGFLFTRIYEILNEDEPSDRSLKFINQNFELLDSLAEKGVVIAVIRLSQLYYLGLGCQQNKEKARKIMESIDYPDHPYYYYWAAKLLIDMYANLQSKSIEYHLRKSADMGYVVAQSTLASLYRTGTIFEENPKFSFEYAQKAAIQGSIESTTMAGYYYMIGYGVAKSTKNARFLLEIAAQAGNKQAKDLLKKL